ncbi:MAG: LysM peptidoglycan-binding domain-containing protein [Chloroflexi bacterium]|nr:LysM peptidoglycan-binding domain-containing protein [Chloroflexota bacterium]MCI0726753.1 LysM peptidoglycan-binding domain-containing protein [Chloroflexota bacterium]
MPEKDLSDDKRTSRARGSAGPGTGKKGKMGGSAAARPATQPATQPPAQPPEPEYMAEHTVASGETLSHIALKYYGSAVKEKWMAIYEANKAVIGDNPSLLRPGQKLRIPRLAAS